MRTTRLRQKIKKFLHSRGEANTTEILEHVNTTMRHGTTPQQLGNVLSKDNDIMKVSTTKRGGALSGENRGLERGIRELVVFKHAWS